MSGSSYVAVVIVDGKTAAARKAARAEAAKRLQAKPTAIELVEEHQIGTAAAPELATTWRTIDAPSDKT